MIYDLIGLVIFVVLALMVVTVIRALTTRPKPDKREHDLLVNRTLQLREARRALNAIANGTSGIPQLDAQVALDEMSKLEMKEINE